MVWTGRAWSEIPEDAAWYDTEEDAESAVVDIGEQDATATSWSIQE